MPSGKTHSKITTLAAMTLSPVCLYVTGDPLAGASFALGILATLPIRVAGATIYLNPDMDIVSNAGRLSRALGLDAYRRTVSHRAGLKRSDWYGIARNPARALLLSHVPIVGTLVRTLPVLLLLFLISTIVYFPKAIYLWTCAGMMMSDTCHIFADLAWSNLRTKRGRG